MSNINHLYRVFIYGMITLMLFSELSYESQTDSVTSSETSTSNLSVSSHKLAGKDLYNLKAENADLRKVFSKLSEVSGIPITVLDTDNNAAVRVSVVFDGLPIQDAVKRVLDQLPAGGLATVSSRQGKGNESPKRIYVITKKGKDSLQARADQLLERVKKGEKPEPKEVAAWLEILFSTVGIVDPAGTSMYVVPVLQMLNMNYVLYKDMVLSLFKDQDTPAAVRAGMLEIIGNHWNDPDSEKIVRQVFMNIGDMPVILGKSARTLAERGVDIGNQLLSRYPTASPEAKFYYAAALAHLGREDAIPLLRSDLKESQASPLRASAIRALGELGGDDPEIIKVLDEVVKTSTKQGNSGGTPLDRNEALSMEAIQALAKSKKPEAYQVLLNTANDESLSVDVRLTAVEVLGGTPEELLPQVKEALNKLNKDVKATTALEEVNKERFSFIIDRVLKQLNGSKSPSN